MLDATKTECQCAVWLLVDSSGIGGIERHIEVLATSLQRADVPAVVVLYARHGATPNPWLEQLQNAGVSVLTLNGTPLSLLSAMKRLRPLLVHTHGYKSGIIGRFAARLVPVPCVSTFHSGERGTFPVGFYSFVDEWTALLSTNIAVSNAIKNRLPFHAQTVQNFIDVPIDFPDSWRDASLPRRVAFVGRLAYEKAPDLFCQIAKSSKVNVDWHIYGDGPMRAELENSYGGLIKFHGVVSDLTGVWPTLGLLVMPSRTEGLPYAALEALASGVPVLASRVGAMASLVHNARTGWLFDVGDLGAACRWIEAWAALAQPQQIEMRRACRNHVQAEFSSTRGLREILGIYRTAGAVFHGYPQI
jgi:glycosyltransferase involved in cell wall biosynthesis